MSSFIALIDGRDLQARDGLATTVAGLSLLERSHRLAAVCGANEIVLITDAPPSPLPALYRQGEGYAERWGSIQVLAPDSPELRSLKAQGRPYLQLRGDRVYKRSLIQDALALLESFAPDDAAYDEEHEILLARGDLPPRELKLTGWSVRVDDDAAVDEAADLLFEGCRKEADGIVARHINRHLSLAMSRRIVRLSIGPNHISALTFLLGGAAALAAAFGGFLGFLAAGVLYQVNSVVDGVDGELARVRYEFSILGEWLDTISDDVSDFLIYLGIGFGAYRTLPDAPGPFGPETWLALGVVAAAAKALSMVVYYRWLRAKGRGDLLAFEWEFEDDQAETSRIKELLSFTRYFFRKDFIVFVAFLLSLVGALPYLLLALAPGNVIVAASVLVQQRR